MSESSPATGAATEPPRAERIPRGEPRGDDVEVQLDPGTARHFTWTLVRLGLAGLLFFRVGGGLGIAGGAVLLALGIHSAYLFIRSLTNETGVLALFGEQLFLPAAPSTGDYTSVSIDRVRHVYLVRRAVPWNTSGPILVIELDGHVFEFPRDWFHDEEDQRRVVEGVRLRKGLR